MLNWFRHRSRRWSWVAALAIFGLVCVPTISRAMAGTSGPSAAWLEICSASGAKLVAVGDTAPAPSAAQHHLDHCPLCGLSADQAPPVQAVSIAPPSALADYRPPLFLRAPRPLFAWTAQPSRAPPLNA